MTQVFQVIKNLWCIRRPSYLTCSYMLRTDRGMVFIDASMDSDGEDIRYALRSIHESEKNVRMCILTHWHNDHSSGADYIQNICGAPIYCHQLEANMLTQPTSNSISHKISDAIPELGPLVLLKGLLKGGPAVQLKSVRIVTEGDILDDRFHILETPGHTPGHISVLDETNKTLFAGDAFAIVHQKLRRMARPVTEDLAGAHQSMLKLLTYDIELVCPGHREPILDAKTEIEVFATELQAKPKSWPFFG